MNIPIVYEDDWLLVLDKPAGLLTIPTPKDEKRTLTSILNEDAKNKGLTVHLHPCHRLDRETSGLIIYAKGKSVQKRMMAEFNCRRVKKSYVAFVHGSLERKEGSIRNPVDGLSAITDYKVLERRNNFSVVQVKPLTGRTNQIRVHFKQIQHPLVGETKFVFRRHFSLKAKRLCLHAEALEFLHPVTGKNIVLSTGLPEDLKKFLNSHD